MKQPERNAAANGRKVILKLMVFWTVVGLPLGWGTWQVVVKSAALFGG